MNSLSTSNTFNHYSRSCTFGSSLNANVSEDNNIGILTNVKDGFMDNSSSENNTTIISHVWTKGTFNNKSKSKSELSVNLTAEKICWSSHNNNNNNDDEDDDEVDVKHDDIEEELITNNVMSPTPDNESVSPSHHARRPMNAFLIFCKKHRPIVRKKFPNLENRGVTRILGEWWALLDENDKKPYKDLAKEYKDAFFSANPDFKWYKLPAPPLRTLTTRPGSVQKEPISSSQSSIQPNPPHESEFTPGKLADESQLGSLSALLTVSNFPKSNDTGNKAIECKVESSYCGYTNIITTTTKAELCLESPPTLIKDTTLPPKPIKKRKFIENFLDSNNKNSVKNIFNVGQLDISDDPEPELKVAKVEFNKDKEEQDSQDSITNKELIEKIIDNTYQNQNTVPQTCSSASNLESSKETRKSGRSCKGKLYAEFMVNGKLIKNKRERRYNSSEMLKKEDEDSPNKTENKSEVTPNFDLQNTIKRLAERTKVSLHQMEDKTELKESERIRTNSESSEDSLIKNKFDLQKRIDELPSLDYDNYMQRKRENKKRKFTKNKMHMSTHQKQKLQSSISSSVNINNNNNIPIGSKKRKNKSSITHLEKKDSHFAGGGGNIVSDDLSGLATLAEIASNKEKINQDKVLM